MCQALIKALSVSLLISASGVVERNLKIKGRGGICFYRQKLMPVTYNVKFWQNKVLAELSIMAADGRANSSSANFSEEDGSFIFPSQFDTRHLKVNKSKLIWSGSFEELFDFAEKYLSDGEAVGERL